jgi:hypothetical protein
MINVQTKPAELRKSLVGKFKLIALTLSKHLNSRFNSLSAQRKKLSLLFFGLVMCGISLSLIIQALQQQEIMTQYTVDKISIPKDAYMNDKSKTSDDQLIPVGKLKGEINGVFEAFYLAVDRNGITYINRSLEFSAGAYNKSHGWEEISRRDLERYSKELHFLRYQGKRLKP